MTSDQRSTTIAPVVDFELVGDGWCRPTGCNVFTATCRVNGIVKDKTRHTECRNYCASNSWCIGYAISSPTHSYPNRCYNYGNIRSVSTAEGNNGWSVFHANYINIAASSTSAESADVSCFKKPDSAPTASPTVSPITSIPTASPTTSIPTASPTTSIPTASPTTSIPTASPTTSIPTASPITSIPTASPTTSIPTASPTTSIPTASPTAAVCSKITTAEARRSEGYIELRIDSDNVVPLRYFTKGEIVFQQCYGAQPRTGIHMRSHDSDFWVGKFEYSLDGGKTYKSDMQCIGCTGGYLPNNMISVAGADHWQEYAEVGCGNGKECNMVIPSSPPTTAQPTTSQITAQPTTSQITAQPTTPQITVQPTTPQITVQPIDANSAKTTKKPSGFSLDERGALKYKNGHVCVGIFFKAEEANLVCSELGLGSHGQIQEIYIVNGKYTMSDFRCSSVFGDVSSLSDCKWREENIWCPKDKGVKLTCSESPKDGHITIPTHNPITVCGPGGCTYFVPTPNPNTVFNGLAGSAVALQGGMSTGVIIVLIVSMFIFICCGGLCCFMIYYKRNKAVKELNDEEVGGESPIEKAIE